MNFKSKVVYRITILFCVLCLHSIHSFAQDNQDTPPSDSAILTTDPPTEESPIADMNSNTQETQSTQVANDDDSIESDLPSPTANLETYEAERLRRFRKLKEPNWSANFTYEHHAFPNVDFKKPTNPPGLQPGKLPTSINPVFRGFLISGERFLTRKVGYLSVGLEGGVYAAKEEDGYNKLPMGLIPVGGYLQYQLHYIDRQWVVPFAKAEYETIIQNYQYEGSSNKGINQLLRADAGALIYLNFLEPWAAGAMQANYGIKRTYLSASFTYSKDMTQKTFDLSERNWRVGFRFEY